LKKEEK